jgi:hypothetical protein
MKMAVVFFCLELDLIGCQGKVSIKKNIFLWGVYRFSITFVIEEKQTIFFENRFKDAQKLLIHSTKRRLIFFLCVCVGVRTVTVRWRPLLADSALVNQLQQDVPLGHLVVPDATLPPSPSTPSTRGLFPSRPRPTTSAPSTTRSTLWRRLLWRP